MKSITSDQILNSLQVGFAGFLATGVYAFAGPDSSGLDSFYVVYGAARSLLPTPEASMASAQARVVGTIFGGVVVALLILVLNNWIAIGIGYVIIQLLGRRMGLGPAALMNASVMAVLLLAIPSHNMQGGWYVFFRTLWHLVGLAIGMVVERLFWFRSPLQRLQESEDRLVQHIQNLLCGDDHQSVEELISIYAKHCKIRRLALRGGAGLKRQPFDVSRREELLERALRHAVAMQRVPDLLRGIDQRACSAAMQALLEPAEV
jgi:hypothetical protein